jgi:hypothetical protein
MTEQRTADRQPVQRNPIALAEALQTFTEATLGVCEGQQYDIDFEQRSDVTVEEYMEMIRLKTSLLLGCALKIGAQLAGAPSSDAESLYGVSSVSSQPKSVSAPYEYIIITNEGQESQYQRIADWKTR